MSQLALVSNNFPFEAWILMNYDTKKWSSLWQLGSLTKSKKRERWLSNWKCKIQNGRYIFSVTVPMHSYLEIKSKRHLSTNKTFVSRLTFRTHSPLFMSVETMLNRPLKQALSVSSLNRRNQLLSQSFGVLWDDGWHLRPRTKSCLLY